MSSVSLNKSVDQPVGPEVDELPVGPSVEPQNISNHVVSAFAQMPQKFFPSWRNG
jgi:hypothetical protein